MAAAYDARQRASLRNCRASGHCCSVMDLQSVNAIIAADMAAETATEPRLWNCTKPADGADAKLILEHLERIERLMIGGGAE